MGLCIVRALAIWTKWAKLQTLLSGDSPWWLHEVARFAWGEIPYRDFYWPYGPLSIAVFSYPMRWFGVRFETAQIVMDVLSLIIVVIYWRIPRGIYCRRGCTCLPYFCWLRSEPLPKRISACSRSRAIRLVFMWRQSACFSCFWGYSVTGSRF